jgi:hypothetical protein
MKKLFVLFAAATLFVGVQACNQKEEAAEEVTEEAVVEEVTEEVAAPADSVAVVDSTAVAK